VRAFAGLALGFALALPAAAAAHQRSQSFSTWRVEGAEVRAVWSVLAFEATRLAPPGAEHGDLGGLLADHLAAGIEVRRGGEPWYYLLFEKPTSTPSS